MPERTHEQDIAQVALTLLDRVQITGAEAEAFLETKAFLMQIESGTITIAETTTKPDLLNAK